MVFLALAAAVSWALGWPPAPWLPHHNAVGMVVFFGGWAPAVWAVRRFVRNGADLDPFAQSNRVLVTDGPYRLSRNPMYLGLTVATLGMAIWVGSWPMLGAPVAVFLVTNFFFIPAEEAKMRAQFGEAYDAYALRVRRWV
jgi:protein-S-isoprenylcysteine O-methyltransferase Ste14